MNIKNSQININIQTERIKRVIVVSDAFPCISEDYTHVFPEHL